MVAFSTSDIPSTITTVERLLVWGNSLMNDLHPNQIILEATDYAERVCQSAPFLVTATDPPEWRVISRTSIGLNSQWRRQGKIWVHALEVSSQSIPTDYKS